MTLRLNFVQNDNFLELMAKHAMILKAEEI